MDPMPATALAALVCPVCRIPFAADSGERRLVCPAGHSFDAAKQGYFNFLTGKGTSFEADAADMVAARFDFLSAGHYRALEEAVTEAAAPFLARPGSVVLDAGTGTGHYLRALLNRAPAAAVALDISKFALRRAARLNPGAVNLAADVWQPLPLADHAVDVVTVVFAPRNAAEFARVLRPGGRLIVVTPRPGHLAAVAGQTGMLAIEPAKEERLAATMGRHFRPHPGRELDIALSLTPDDVAQLALMGPAGHHLDREALAGRVSALPPRTADSALFRVSVFEPLPVRGRPGPV